METLWFCLVGLMLTAYVVFDGFDLGAGCVHLFAARTESERRLVLQSIGPVWDGNEVWLIAAAGTLYFAFPKLYASSFSGFYLPLMMVLWLLILRGVSIEFRHHLSNKPWSDFWDVVFAGSSMLLAVFLGAALGNVVRGVPLDQDGRFFLPLWTNFRLGNEPGILDWYTISVGLAALAALTNHGALWVTMKTERNLQRRTATVAAWCWWAVAGLTLVVTLATFWIQPLVPGRFASQPWGVVFPVIGLIGLTGIRRFSARGERTRAFLASCTYLAGLLASVAFGLYPYVLPSLGAAESSLDIYNAAAGGYGLRVGLFWFMPGMLLVTAYFVFTYRRFAGKVELVPCV